MPREIVWSPGSRAVEGREVLADDQYTWQHRNSSCGIAQLFLHCRLLLYGLLVSGHHDIARFLTADMEVVQCEVVLDRESWTAFSTPIPLTSSIFGKILALLKPGTVFTSMVKSSLPVQKWSTRTMPEQSKAR